LLEGVLMTLLSSFGRRVPGGHFSSWEIHASRHLGSICDRVMAGTLISSTIGTGVTGRSIDLGVEFEFRLQIVAV